MPGIVAGLIAAAVGVLVAFGGSFALVSSQSQLPAADAPTTVVQYGTTGTG